MLDLKFRKVQAIAGKDEIFRQRTVQPCTKLGVFSCYTAIVKSCHICEGHNEALLWLEEVKSLLVGLYFDPNSVLIATPVNIPSRGGYAYGGQ